MPKIPSPNVRIPPKRILYQQCRDGIDANPDAYPHDAHVHQTKHGRPVVCRGWFPITSPVRRALLRRRAP